MKRTRTVLHVLAAALIAPAGAILPTLGFDAPGPAAEQVTAPAPAKQAKAAPKDAATAVAPMERPFLWRIEGEVPSYLFGTIHLPDQRVTALAASVEAAMASADVVVTEIHLVPASRQAVAAAAMLPGDQTLKSLLPEALYARAGTFLGERGLPIAALSKLKIWALATQVGLIDYLPQMMMMEPLDLMLHSRATRAGVRTEGLETVEEQMQIFDGLAVEDQIEMLEKALDQVEAAQAEGTSPARDLVAAYLTGDESVLLAKIADSIDPTDEAESALLEKLLDERNHRMAERIEARLAAEPGTSWFFAVGAGHVAGEEGLVTLLGARGLELVRLPGELEEQEAGTESGSRSTADADPEAAPAGGR